MSHTKIGGTELNVNVPLNMQFVRVDHTVRVRITVEEGYINITGTDNDIEIDHVLYLHCLLAVIHPVLSHHRIH